MSLVKNGVKMFLNLVHIYVVGVDVMNPHHPYTARYHDGKSGVWAKRKNWPTNVYPDPTPRYPVQ